VLENAEMYVTKLTYVKMRWAQMQSTNKFGSHSNVLTLTSHHRILVKTSPDTNQILNFFKWQTFWNITNLYSSRASHNYDPYRYHLLYSIIIMMLPKWDYVRMVESSQMLNVSLLYVANFLHRDLIWTKPTQKHSTLRTTAQPGQVRDVLKWDFPVII